MTTETGKLVSESTEAIEMLVDFVSESAENAESFHAVEKETLSRVLQMRRLAMDGFIRLQGDGDLGEEVQTEDGRTLRRSDEPVSTGRAGAPQRLVLATQEPLERTLPLEEWSRGTGGSLFYRFGSDDEERSRVAEAWTKVARDVRSAVR